MQDHFPVALLCDNFYEHPALDYTICYRFIANNLRQTLFVLSDGRLVH